MGRAADKAVQVEHMADLVAFDLGGSQGDKVSNPLVAGGH